MIPSAAHRPANAPTPQPSWVRDSILLLIVFGGLFALLLGSMPLANPDEGRYAEIAREMLLSGDWVTPRLNDVVYFEKPPLVYWLTASAFHLFGVNAWAARLPNALSALAGILLVYAAGRALYGRTAGSLAAVILGTSLFYFGIGRILTLDTTMAVLLGAALFFFILAVRAPPGRNRRLLFYGLYASSALATLTKGLIGFLIPGAVYFLWLLVFRQWRHLRPFYLPTGLLLFLAIAVPWHLLCAHRNPHWAAFYLVHEHWLRFTTATHGRTEPAWYFLAVLFLGFFPWSGYLAPALFANIAQHWRARDKHLQGWFLFTATVFIFLFFSSSHSKLATYILPAFPPLAILMGAWIARELEQNDATSARTGLSVFSVSATAVGAAAALLVFYPQMIRDRDLAEAARWHAAGAAIMLIAGAWLVWPVKRHYGLRGALSVQTATAASLLVVLILTAPTVVHRNTKALAEIFTTRAGPSDRIYHYYAFFHDFVFYSGQFVGTIGYRYEPGAELELAIDERARASGRFIDNEEFRRQWETATRIWVLARKRDVAPLLADRSFRYFTQGQSRSHVLISNQP